MRAMPGALTPQLGLISRSGLIDAAARFGLAPRDDVTSYEALAAATGRGQPVLVDVRNTQFPEGHWMVVTAADSRGVTVVDSSGYRLTSMARQEFVDSWSGRGIRVQLSSQPVGARHASPLPSKIAGA
jgi:ABC-type bacteriocin/lantibiotic exporter with double-glycine peptidase domain